MIPLTSSQLQTLTGADRLELASMVEDSLYVGGEEMTLVREVSVDAEEGPGVVLEANLAEYLPDLSGEVSVVYDIAGEDAVAYLGEVADVEAKSYETVLLASTPSHHAEDILIGHHSGHDLSYVEAAPSQALYEVAARLDYRGIDIPDTPRPRFSRTGEDTLRWTDNIADAYEAIRDETGLALWDTPLSGAEGYLERFLLSSGEVQWTFTEGVDFDFGELEVTTPEERYARVVVYRAAEDGTHIPLASAEVENHGIPVRDDAVLPVELTDEDEVSASEKAYTEARRLQDNALSFSFPLIYPPFFLTRGDQVRITGRVITDEGIHERLYRARLTGVKTEGKAGTMKAVGRMMGVEEVVSVEPVAPERASVAPVLPAPAGLTWDTSYTWDDFEIYTWED